MSNELKIERTGETLIIRFDRPEIRSPLSVTVLEQVSDAIAAIGPSVKSVIFTGTENVFASGADLREIAGVGGGNAREFALRGQDLMSRIAGLPVVTIAAVNGFCFGGALDLALACGSRIASPNAEFCHPGANLGIMTGWGGTQRLPRLVGESTALEMFLTTKRVNAQEALRIGLIHSIAEDPLREAMNFTGRSLNP